MKSNLSLLHIVLALLTLAPMAHAERTVGNGGGLAEMRAIYLHQRLSSYLIPCVVNPASCGLNAKQALSFAQAVKASAMAVPSSLIIDPAISEEEVFQTTISNGAVIRLSPKALYFKIGATSVPKSISEIAGVLLGAYWTQSGAESKTNAIALATSLTSRFEETSSELEVRASTAASIKVHQQVLRLGEVEEIMILIEDKLKTINVTPTELESLVCESGAKPTRTDVQALRAVEANASGVTVAFEVVSDCSADVVAALNYKTIVLSFKLTPKGEIIETSVRSTMTDSL